MHYSELRERGYSWLSFHPSQQWKYSLAVTVAILVASIAFFAWCAHVSDDMGGDSFVGLVFAVGCTVFLFLAAVSFSLHRRAKKRTVGGLNAVLNWHMCFGTISLVMVFLHAFGNYNPRTGTYALYGMIALVISGIIGRILDRLMPRMITQEAVRTLTAQGNDRIENISQQLQSAVVYNTYDRRGGFPYSDELMLGTNAYTSAIQDVQQAFMREQFYRRVIRYWRVFHIILAVVTVGLTLWHIEYALALIIPTLQKYGFGYLLPWP